MEYFTFFSHPTSFYPPQIVFFWIVSFCKKVSQPCSGRFSFFQIPQHRCRIVEWEVSTKIACMVPRETYRFTSKPFDMYARRRLLVSELFTGVSKIGTRRVRVIRLALPCETSRKSWPAGREGFPVTSTVPIPMFPPTCRCTCTPPPVGRRVPCPTGVDNVSLVEHGTIRHQVTHYYTIGNFPKPSTTTGRRLWEHVQEYTRPFPNPVDLGGQPQNAWLSHRLLPSIKNKRHRDVRFLFAAGMCLDYSSHFWRVHSRPISRTFVSPTWCVGPPY